MKLLAFSDSHFNLFSSSLMSLSNFSFSLSKFSEFIVFSDNLDSADSSFDWICNNFWSASDLNFSSSALRFVEVSIDSLLVMMSS